MFRRFSLISRKKFMSRYNNNNDGCSTIIYLLIVVPILLFFAGKGCVSCADSVFKSTSRSNRSSNSQSSNEDNHKWGENGVDPVLRTSTGGIYKDPNYPNHYFDITTPCHQCKGKGSWETITTNPDAYDSNGKLRSNVPIGKTEIVKCSACYGTGFEKRPIPPDGKIPLKSYPNN